MRSKLRRDSKRVKSSVSVSSGSKLAASLQAADAALRRDRSLRDRCGSLERGIGLGLPDTMTTEGIQRQEGRQNETEGRQDGHNDRSSLEDSSLVAVRSGLGNTKGGEASCPTRGCVNQDLLRDAARESCHIFLALSSEP